jgi:hypothetical protein
MVNQTSMGRVSAIAASLEIRSSRSDLHLEAEIDVAGGTIAAQVDLKIAN